jgi:Right handed beta helix region
MTWPSSSFAKLWCVFIFFAVSTLLFSAPAHGQSTIYVPGNYPTIQSAINSANNGDTILVAPGTYVENINFNGKAITVTSSGGAAATIIDGNHNGTVVTFNHSETAASVLFGFTIRNGYLDGGFGAGIAVISASPTIKSNVVTGNHAAVGLGIFVNGGSPLIQNNTISNNDQMNAGDGGSGGGGILIFGGSSGLVQIIGNTITNNNMQSGGQGGGISVAGGGALLQGNLISGNIVYNEGGGITAYNVFAPLTIVQNVIVNNVALTGKGGGINLSLPSSSAAVFVTNNTIANNTGYANTSGVYTTGFAQPATLANNIIAAPAGQDPVTCDGTYSTVSPTFSHNDAYSIGSNSSGFFGFCVAGSSGNFSADPLFLSAANNDFHVSSASPIVDAGDNSASGLPATDFDNNPRISDGNGGAAAIVDLGAYELVGTSSATLNPGTLAFPSSAVGSPSSPQIVTLTSSGSAPFQISSVQISGDFAQTSSCPVLSAPGSNPGVASGSTCTFSVTFTPTATGTRTGLLTVNGTNGARLLVSLIGTGDHGAVGSISPASLSFPAQPVATSSAPQVLTLSNSGDAVLTISTIVVNGPYSQSSNCGSALAAGSSCSINVTFNPVLYGQANGSLTVTDNVGNTYVSSLNGTGVDFALSVAPSSASVVRGNSTTFTVTTSALGDAFANAVALSCAGLPAKASCSFSPATVVPGASGATSTMIILTNQANTQVGSFNVAIIGKSGSLAHSTVVQLTVVKR